MSKCKYCQEHELLVDYEPEDIFDGNYLSISIESGGRLDCDWGGQDTFESPMEMNTSIQISYCPICGRHLTGIMPSDSK